MKSQSIMVFEFGMFPVLLFLMKVHQTEMIKALPPCSELLEDLLKNSGC